MGCRFRNAACGMAFLGAIIPCPGFAFFADGYWSGMTPQQVAFVAATQGMVAQPAVAGLWIVGTTMPPMVVATLGFCGNYLTSYIREIHSDADYAATLAAIFATYGPPRKMSFSGDVTPSTTHGRFVASGKTRWSLGTERVTMDSDFDWRLSGGALRREQPATIHYETFSPCSRP